MAYNGVKQIVIDSTTKEVKRFGYCDMENDGQFNDGTETMIENDFIFDPPISQKVWTWNDTTFVEGSSQPESEHSHTIQQIDLNESSKNSSYKTMGRIIYLGTKRVGPISHIEAIAYMDDGVTSYDIRVVDKGNNSAVVAEVTGLTNTDDKIIDLGTISNLSATKTRFDIQIRVVDGGSSKKGRLDSILIKY
jgi:hypothetical protein